MQQIPQIHVCDALFYLQILRHVINPLFKVSLALSERFLIGQEVGHKLISFFIHHTSIFHKQQVTFNKNNKNKTTTKTKIKAVEEENRENTSDHT